MFQNNIFDRLQKSPFRSRFHLSQKDKDYVMRKGMDVIKKHAEDFVRQRLAPAVILNDGKQTPMRGHPVFVAQHACACCCRSCLSKWHHICMNEALSQKTQDEIVSVLMKWIQKEMSR